jgi:hypothetical protein
VSMLIDLGGQVIEIKRQVWLHKRLNERTRKPAQIFGAFAYSTAGTSVSLDTFNLGLLNPFDRSQGMP